ncbi:alpha/beta hydrolase [Tunturiibacter lichenicola]|uniref:alpha/beta hydrolase n=1 Tax=Tunturiibacter lichenicola TaxID=2051959 RepID=UPI0021B3E9C1|nr:lysophospholipase [Edaphobacter lichenicola]
MPRPTPKSNTQPSPKVQYDDVSPMWLVKAIAATIVAALFCGYLTFCLLFYQGQWQLVLHPSRASSAPASIAGIPYELTHFGIDESATPQLTGWWIPSAPGARYARTTILFLPGSEGSLTDSISTLASLHNIGLNVFAFDYRGYGQSAPTRPSQLNMTSDADSAWQYLTTSRAIPASQIIPYGTGIGASLATKLAADHTSVPGLILDAPRADLLDVAKRDPRSRLIPVSLLFHERFPLAAPLSALKTPKLLISRTTSPDEIFLHASDPKLTVELPSLSETLYNQSLTRFLDQYLPPAPVPQLVPTPAPTR